MKSRLTFDKNPIKSRLTYVTHTHARTHTKGQHRIVLYIFYLHQRIFLFTGINIIYNIVIFTISYEHAHICNICGITFTDREESELYQR